MYLFCSFYLVTFWLSFIILIIKLYNLIYFKLKAKKCHISVRVRPSSLIKIFSDKVYIRIILGANISYFIFLIGTESTYFTVNSYLYSCVVSICCCWCFCFCCKITYTMTIHSYYRILRLIYHILYESFFIYYANYIHVLKQ